MEAGKLKSIPGDVAAVNKRMSSSIRGEPKELYDAARHLIVSGGKRLRPYMVIQSCRMLGGKRSNALAAAGAVEMVHNFTLVHDDIMDGDEMRHGVPTVHKKFGMPVAILTGDVLFSKAYQMLARSAMPEGVISRLVGMLAGACVEVCEGQAEDMAMAAGTGIPTRAQYISMIRKKTASLFEVSCAMGATCAGAGKKDVANLASFGRNLGVAFQITDDLIGVMGDPGVTKKPVGNDLREGKKSLPILLSIRKARGADKKTILGAFGNRRATKVRLAKAVGVISGLGVEGMVRDAALGYADKARRSLDGYSGRPKDELGGLLDFVVKRSK